MGELVDRICADIEKYEKETGRKYRTAFKMCGKELSCVITPQDLGLDRPPGKEDAKNPEKNSEMP